jgi:hypothetical protein
MLAMYEEALRHNQVKRIFCPGHRNVKQAALFLEFSCCAGTEIRRHTTVDDIEGVDRFPFLTLRGVDGRENKIILIAQRRP